MKRWNGWGDEKVDYPLPDSAARYLAELVGPGRHSEAVIVRAYDPLAQLCRHRHGGPPFTFAA